MTDAMVTDRWGQMWLPLRPLASDDLLAGVYRHARPEALGMRYIESNPQALSNLLVVDIDHPDAAMRARWQRPGGGPTSSSRTPQTATHTPCGRCLNPSPAPSTHDVSPWHWPRRSQRVSGGPWTAIRAIPGY